MLLGFSEIPHKEDILKPAQEASISIDDLDCLIKNAYHEAFGEGPLGMAVVTQVVINRAQKTRESLCETVFKYKQFSWTLGREKTLSQDSYERTKSTVLAVYYGFMEIPSHLKNATHFHTLQVKPYWSKSLKRLGVLKNHVFYEGV
jgi:spore germination cell wall hydrolase CwlJ-like protein